MVTASELPREIERCHALLQTQATTIASQTEKLAELTSEMEKMRKLLSYFVNGHRSERRILPAESQSCLPFESSEEFQAARAEAEAQAEAIVQTYTVTRTVNKKKRDESLPSHLPRVEEIVEGNERGEDLRRTRRAEADRLRYDRDAGLQAPGVACAGAEVRQVRLRGRARLRQWPRPEAITSLVEGDRYEHQRSGGGGRGQKWTPASADLPPAGRVRGKRLDSQPFRQLLLNLVGKVDFVVQPLVAHMTRLVQRDAGVGIDETSCRMLLPGDPPPAIPGDAKSRRLAEKIAETRSKGDSSLLAKMWVYSGLYRAPYNIFDFRVSRHRDGPDDFFRDSRCIVQGDCFSGNLSVVLHSDDRLTFAACWAHARRKVVEAKTYAKECELLLGMLQALYDIEARGKDLSWQDRQALRERESTVVLTAIQGWLDTVPLRDVLPKSDFAEALRYIRNHWEALCVFVRDGRIPIDNNLVEQLMKQVAMGRKAWLFVCSVEGGEQSALLMTLASSARRHDLDVGLYLKDVLDRLLAGCTDYDRLLPDVWKQSHPDAVREYRAEERRDKAERKQLDAARRRLARRQS